MRSLFDAYLAGDAPQFFARDPRSAEQRARAVELAARRPLDPRVLASLQQQQAQLGPSPARDQNLAALAAGGCAVVTGQQVGLFLGPLFTIYKAATAVRLAAALQNQTGRAVVPIFWLQTEDHDLPEIARCVLPRRHEPAFTIAADIATDNRSSIAHVRLPDTIHGCIEQLRLELGQLPHAQAHLERIARHYRPGRGWGEAFAGLLSELFEPEGLLVLDPRTPELAQLAAPVHRRALEHSDALSEALLAQNAALTRAGFAATVHVRGDSPLSFFHPAGAPGPRTRLRKSAERFEELQSGREHTLAELLARLEREPLCFSSSALLRPIVQDSLLPTAAYVGGPAEVAYFAQLPPLYEAFGLELGLVVARARVRLIEPAAARLLGRLSLSAADVQRGEPDLLAQLALADNPGARPPVPEQFERELLRRFEATLDQALAGLPSTLTHGLAAHADKTRAKLRLTSHKLAQRYAAELLRHDSQRRSELQRLKHLLFPDGAPQERVFGLPYYAARYGERALIERILEAVDPWVSGAGADASNIVELTL